MPKASFVMPTKNRSDIISDSVRSIIGQTEADWELIVVDDHSDIFDKTEDVLCEFGDSRIKYFQLPDGNGHGIAAARNYGNAMASGPIICVIDSDDLCYEDRLGDTLNEFSQTDCDVVYGEIDWWNPETGEVTKRQSKSSAVPFSLKKYRINNFIPHSTVAYKKELSLDFPYNSFFEVCEDYDMLSRLAIHGYEFGFIDKSLVKYRRHSDSTIGNSRNEELYLDVIRNGRAWKP